MRYLRSKNNGVIFEYTERLAANPNVEEITEQEAYPERFAPVDISKRKPTIDITIPEEVVKPAPEVAPELIAEASRPMGRGRPVVTPARTVKQTTKSAVPSFAGLVGDI